MFRVTTKLNHLGKLGTFYLPGMAVTQPMVRVFNLVTVLDMLVEHAVFITQTITGYRKF